LFLLNNKKELNVRYYVKEEDEWKFIGQTENKRDEDLVFETSFVQDYKMNEL
jgi:hypothetical protein